MAPDEPTTPKGRRLRRSPEGIPAHLLEEWMLDYRFVKEVERLELDGRVESRGGLEMRIGMTPGTIGLIRQGRMHPKATHIARLQRAYNADLDYILFGIRNIEKADSTAPRDGKLVNFSQYPPYAYEYKRPSGWLVGPRPELDARHYPPDPTGVIWVPHPQATTLVRKWYERYKEQHPELDLGQYERPDWEPPTSPAHVALAQQNVELRAYLNTPLMPDNPAAGSRLSAFAKGLNKLPVFRYPPHHPKAGQQGPRFKHWRYSDSYSLNAEEIAAVWEWLKAGPEKSPAE